MLFDVLLLLSVFFVVVLSLLLIWLLLVLLLLLLVLALITVGFRCYSCWRFALVVVGVVAAVVLEVVAGSLEVALRLRIVSIDVW